MKDMTFSKIFKALFCIFIFMGFLCIRHVFIADASPLVEVVEDITYNSTTGEYTYGYTLTNSGTDTIYWWGIFYEEDPNAIFSTADKEDAGVYCSEDWLNTALPQHGGFMPYTDPDPSGNGTGFLSTAASDFTSGEAQEDGWSNGTIWITQAEYDLLAPAVQDTYGPATIGGNYGWTGDGANIQTIYGIGQNDQGSYTMKSEEEFTGDKTFFYNTINWWDAWMVDDDGTPLDYTDDEIVNGGFEETGTTQEYEEPSSGGTGGTPQWLWFPTYYQNFYLQTWLADYASVGLAAYQQPSFYQPYTPTFQQQLFQFPTYTPTFQQQWYQPFQPQQWYQPQSYNFQQQQWYQPQSQSWNFQQLQW